MPCTAVNDAVGGVKDDLQGKDKAQGRRGVWRRTPRDARAHALYSRVQRRPLDDAEVRDAPLPLRIPRKNRIVAADAEHGRRGADVPRDNDAAGEHTLDEK